VRQDKDPFLFFL